MSFKYSGTIHTPHDGDYVDPVVSWDAYPGRGIIVQLNGENIALLGCERHRLWKMNPGFRELVLQHVRAETLVGA